MTIRLLPTRPAPIAMPLIQPSLHAQHDPWSSTAPGALLEGAGSPVRQVRVLHTDGSDTTLPTAAPKQPLRLLKPGEPYAPGAPYAHSAPTTYADLAQADVELDVWRDRHSPHRQAQPARRSTPTPPNQTPQVSAPQADRLRRATMAHKSAMPTDRIPTWLLAVGALVIVATIAASSLAPWGWALPL